MVIVIARQWKRQIGQEQQVHLRIRTVSELKVIMKNRD